MSEENKSGGNLFFDILTYMFMFLAIIFTILSIGMKTNPKDGMPLFDYQMLIVQSGSMAKNDLVNVEDYEIKSIEKDSMVFIKTVDQSNPYRFYSQIKVNDVVTFKYVIGNKLETITHRVIGIEAKPGGYIFTFRGDNISAFGNTSVQTIDTTDIYSYNKIIGKVVGVSYEVGVVVNAVKSDIGLIFCIIVPSVLLLIFEFVDLIAISKEDKKEKFVEETVLEETVFEETVEETIEEVVAPPITSDTTVVPKTQVAPKISVVPKTQVAPKISVVPKVDD